MHCPACRRRDKHNPVPRRSYLPCADNRRPDRRNPPFLPAKQEHPSAQRQVAQQARNCGLRLCNGCRRTFLRHNRILLGPVGRSILGSTPLNHFMVIFVRHRMRIRFAGQRIEQPGENDLMGTAIDRMQHFTNQSPGKTSFHQRDAPQGVITVSGVFIAVTATLEPENRDNTTNRSARQ